MRHYATQPWYKNGLHFECKQCGNCCSGTPGHVWITDNDIMSISKCLEIDEAAFRRRFVIQKHEGMVLAERQNDDCVFFNHSYGCVIYNHRPRQCTTWPFWRSNLTTAETWSSTAVNCPGMNHGKLIKLDQIIEFIEDDGLPYT